MCMHGSSTLFCHLSGSVLLFHQVEDSQVAGTGSPYLLIQSAYGCILLIVQAVFVHGFATIPCYMPAWAVQCHF